MRGPVFAPSGVEVEVRSDARAMIVHRFTTGIEAMARAEKERHDFETNQ
jgi:hypothetical protein